MTSRRDIDRALARHPVVGSEPNPYRFGPLHVHPDRASLKALPMEARVWAKSFFRRDDPRPFVIYGRPRSGTTLLVRLLDQVPDLRCDGELLHHFLIDPVGFLARLPRRAGPGVRAYGVKLISYHLLEVQRVRRPLAFFDRIAAHGYGVLHLTRDTWDQTLSLAKAEVTRVYFSAKGEARQIRLDPDRVLEMLVWNDRMLSYEREVMAHVAHVGVSYEEDLEKPERHQQTVDRLCAHLGVPSGEVRATMKRTGGQDGLHRVENMEEVAARVRRSPLAHLVPDRL